MKLSIKPKDDEYNYGYRRFNTLASFVNAVYLVFTFIFEFVDQLHHIVEHWEEESHEEGSHDSK